jgi:SAM-dependent MidA family methyltransferase
VNILSQIIRAETAASGVLPFARFMELALYCPIHGYYERQKDNVGRGGDFITSVSTGGLFGELLAFQFAGWLEELHSPLVTRHSSLRLIEAGAHDGRLAGDILGWLQLNRPELFSRLEYCLLEPSARRQEWQRETLKPFAPRVRWLSSFSEMVGRDSVEPKSKTINGIIFSNELLDAFPVHRYGWDAKNKKWFEWGVAVEGEKFVWTRMADTLAPPNGERDGERGAFKNSPSSIFHLPSSLLEVLPDGYFVETSPAAESWWREAAGVLEHGKLVAIDYGFTGDEQFSPSRTNGTLRAYFRHHVSDDLLANVGEQDLTAHVNFSAIQKAGEEAGLKTEFFGTQTKFLTEILKTQSAIPNSQFAISPRQFQTLTHPEHLGRAFRVLVQSR